MSNERRTNYLDLVKPSVGATNWASAMNGNMEKIDSGYGALDSQVAIIQNQLGTVGFIYINPNENYVIVHIDKLQLGTIIDNEFQETRTLLPSDYSNIEDYNGWYIYQNYTSDINNLGIPPSDENWEVGDIMVKTSRIDISGRVPIFRHFPQALGGYYKPISDSKVLPKVVFEKILPQDAPPTTNIDIPLMYSNGNINYINFNSSSPSWTFITTGNTTTGTLNYAITKVNDNYPPAVNVNFFVKNNNIWQRIEIDYGFIINGDNYNLVVNMDGISESEYNTFIVGLTVFEKQEA